MESGLALLEMGPSMRIIYVSPSFFRAIGMTADRCALPCSLSRIIHPDDIKDFERVLRKGLEKGNLVNHTHRVSPDGIKWMWWQVRAYQISYDNPYPVMLITTTDVSAFKERELRLREANRRLETAFEQTAQHLWEVDIGSRTFTAFNRKNADGSYVFRGVFPESLLSGGWIHPDSALRFQDFAKGLLEGQQQGTGNFIVQHEDTGCYNWAALSFRMICDETGEPVKAVGVFEYLTQGSDGQEARSVLIRPMPRSLRPHLILGMQANLTRNTVRNLWIEGKPLAPGASQLSCDHVLRQEEERLFSYNERQELKDYFCRERLLELFSAGKRWIRIAYRRVDGEGNIRWVRETINMVEAPLTQDIFLFAYLVEHDRRHRWEMELEGGDLLDGSTGLYKPAAFRSMAEARMREAGGGACAMAVLQVGRKDWLWDKSGVGDYSNGYYVAAALSVVLEPVSILGLYDQGRLIAFFPEAPSRDKLKKCLEDAFTFARLSLSDILFLEHQRFVAGVICARGGQGDFSAMASQGMQLCQLWQNVPVDTVAFPKDAEDWVWGELQRFRAGDQVTVYRTEMDRPLSDAEKDVALRCVSAMLSAESMEASIRSVLSYIGIYYRADRVYVLTLTEDRQTVTMPYEWTGPQKHSIQQAVSGLFLDRFPLFQRCMRERAPVFLTRSQPGGAEGAAEKHWHFTAFPLIDGEAIIGFLCIENSQDHPADAALFGTLIPHIIREQKRFHARLQMPGDPSGVFLSELPNLRSYMNMIYSISSEAYSSLGALCLDIPGLSAINSSLGFEYGSRMLWYVSKTMGDIFGRALLFRTWDAEFVVLCPDTTRQVFVGRCNRLRAELQRRYPKRLRIGYAWSEGIFTGRSLVNEARAIMRCERVEAEQGAPSIGTSSGGQSACPGRFALFLQPKIHMPTGALLGAEVLARGVDREGKLILPDRFIRELEENGTIRDLDLYVLENTLCLMEQWRKRDLTLFPMSVNFSRLTLFDPASPASVLAIQSRHPLITPELLELEITESGVKADSQALAEVLDRFRELGMRFSLDDFGSEYSNISIFTNVKFDSVKLDRSLIAHLPSNPKGQMLVQDLVDICHACGMICVAEGVENRAQIAALTEAGCGYGQGYYFDRPLSVEAFEEKYLRPASP